MPRRRTLLLARALRLDGYNVMMLPADNITDVLPPYSGAVSVWKLGGKTVSQGSEVPQVGMASNYSILLDSEGAPHRRFTWVQDNKVTASLAHQPLHGASVFDARGTYLGQGGETLQLPLPHSEGPKSLVEEVMRQSPTPRKPWPTLVHRFRLRRDFEVQFTLPEELTRVDLERLVAFLRLLPLAED